MTQQKRVGTFNFTIPLQTSHASFFLIKNLKIRKLNILSIGQSTKNAEKKN